MKDQLLIFENEVVGLEEVVIDGLEAFKVHARTLPFNCVMSSTLFTAEAIEAAAASFDGVPVPFGHPKNSEGKPISARSPVGRAKADFFAHCSNVRTEDDSKGRKGLSMDIIVFKERAKESEHGRKAVEMLGTMAAGGDPLSSSIGAYYDTIPAPEGVGYDNVAVNMRGDHNSLLPPGVEPAHSVSQGTGIGVHEHESVHVFSRTDAAFPDLETKAESSQDKFFDKFLNRLGNFMDRRNPEMENEDTKGAEAQKESEDTKAFEARLTAIESQVSAENLTKIFEAVIKPVKEDQELMVKEIKEKRDAERLEVFNAVVEAGMLTKEVADNTPTEALQAMAKTITKGDAQDVSKSGDGAKDEDPLAAFDAEPAKGDDESKEEEKS